MGWYDRDKYDRDYDRRKEARRDLERRGFEVRGNRFDDPNNVLRTGGHIGPDGTIHRDM